MGKYVCVKGFECEVCHDLGMLQVISENYIRVRHYLGVDKDSKKPKFYYHKQNRAYAVQELARLKLKVETHSNANKPNKGNSNQVDQDSTLNIDLKLKESGSFIGNEVWAGSSVRTEHHPPKVGVVGSSPTPPV
jgi:hypothetical protein